MKFRTGLITMGVLWLGLAATAHAQNHMLVLLDRTGSMLSTRSTGHTRCSDALDQAVADVNAFFDANPSGDLSVWTFANDGGTMLTGFTNRASALAALNALAANGCSGVTPLAEAMCTASDFLTTSFPGALKGAKRLAVSSDGEENNSGGECFGPPSLLSPPPAGNYTGGSWQQKVWTKLTAQNTVLVRYWISVIKSEDAVDSETGKALVGCTDAAFFQDVAAASGGTYEAHYDGNPMASQVPSLTLFGALALVLLLLAVGFKALRRAKA